ncbi:MAG: hypothetical protein C0392_06850 [Syntrophus sp. (in: bacteria)]|nr:hypothetical protein [Syntrophus sp. (in: bacteria)]
MDRLHMTRTHVCLVSAQPIPNLIPLRMEELMPGRVVLLVSHDMAAPAARMARIIREWGLAVEEMPIEPYDLDAARETCLDLLVKLDGNEVILNVTAGTKIMALAAFEVFRELGKKIIYVDTQNKRIQALSPEPYTIPFRDVIKVKPYLAAYGQRIREDKTDREIVRKHKHLVDGLIRRADTFESAISILNAYTAGHRHTRTFPLHVAVQEQHLQIPEFNELLASLEEWGIIKREGSLIIIPHLAGVEFLSGGWLEEYVFDVASTLPLTDIMMDVTVEWDIPGRKTPDNEYDVVFTCENKLYLIECKTKRFIGADREETNDELIYKLENLKEAAGGVYGKGMLVSYRRLTDVQKRRLAANSLEFCDGPALKNLRERLIAWTRQ